MSRICGPTATNRRTGRARGVLFGALALLLLSGCAPAPTIAKVGLLAPFEGLYREQGYDALAAVRRGLEACAPEGMTLIPLALDSGTQPEQARRAAAKLMLDPAVIAVIGPLDLAGTAAAAEVIAAHDLPWIVPALIAPQGGYPRQPSAASLQILVADLLQVQTPPPARLLVLGVPQAWQSGDWPDAMGGVPVLWVDSPAALLERVQRGDAVLWLGLPDGAAQLQQQLDQAGIAVTLWLGPASGGAVFAAHAASGPETRWVIWQAAQYNGGSPAPDPEEANHALIYQATCAALAAASGTAPERPFWNLVAYRLRADGAFTP